MIPQYLEFECRPIFKKISTHEKSLVISYCIFIGLFLLSGPAEYFFGINNRVLTIVAYLVLLSSLGLIVWPRFLQLRWFYFLLELYLFLILLIEWLIRESSFLQPFVAFSKLTLIVLGLSTIEKAQSTSLLRSVIPVVKAAIFAVFLVSLIQYFKLPLFEVFSYYGGNFISGTYLLNTRTNGGIGGTAVDFAVLIIQLNFFIVAISNRQKVLENVFWLLLLSFLVLMNFSRVVFLSLIFVIPAFVAVNVRSIKVILRIMVTLVIFTMLMIMLFPSFLGDIIEYLSFSNEYTYSSDLGRLSQWEYSLNEWIVTPATILIGSSFGKNLGLPDSSKTVADGHFVSFLHDTGIIGLLLYTIMITFVFRRMVLRCKSYRARFVAIMYLFSFILFNFVNSGFDHHLNIMLFPIVMMAIDSIK